MKPFRYVQSFVDRKTGAVFHYFRRRGYPRIRLSQGSCGFMEAYPAGVREPANAHRRDADEGGLPLSSVTTVRLFTSNRWHQARNKSAVAFWNDFEPSMATGLSPICRRNLQALP